MNEFPLDKNRYDERLFQLIPHRPPMLLINKVIDVNQQSSSAYVYIDEETPFCLSNKGVPAWIGLEYMGQTAALIAGFQLQQGLVEPHLGFLLGTRTFKTELEYFPIGSILKVSCEESVVVGDNLATFDCKIATYCENTQSSVVVAAASLSVFRRRVN